VVCRAKIAGIKLVEAFRRQRGADFISLMWTNLFSAGDNYQSLKVGAGRRRKSIARHRNIAI
jgi:hypothetical protein